MRACWALRAHLAPACNLLLLLAGGATRGWRPCMPAAHPPAPWFLTRAGAHACCAATGTVALAGGAARGWRPCGSAACLPAPWLLAGAEAGALAWCESAPRPCATAGWLRRARLAPVGGLLLAHLRPAALLRAHLRPAAPPAARSPTPCRATCPPAPRRAAC